MVIPGKIRILPFFHSFEVDQIRAIMPYFELRKYSPGEVVLQQKKINTRLYFLSSGSVSVSIDDKFITEVNELGEVFGEMSLANYSACTATVTALTEVEFLVFHFEEMRKTIAPAIKDGVMKNFYKGTMEILAMKLLNTNRRISPSD
jgi:CRP-like cAMP-binding protein